MIGQKIIELLDAQTVKHIGRGEERERRAYTRASELGWLNECPRHLVLMRLCPEAEKEHNIERQRRLDEGKRQEVIIRQELLEAGVAFSKKEIKPLLAPKLKLKGEVDDIIEVNGNLFPIDYKTSASGVFREVKRYSTSEELQRSRLFWIRLNPWQILAYNILNKTALGFLLYKNLDTAEKHMIDVPLEGNLFKFIEEGLSEINTYVEREELPTLINETDVCHHCGFEETVCYLEGKKEGGVVLNEPEIEILLLERQKLVDAGIPVRARELEELEKKIRSTIKWIAPRLLIGDFEILNTSYSRKIDKTPAEIKKQYEGTMEVVRTKINYLGGTL